MSVMNRLAALESRDWEKRLLAVRELRERPVHERIPVLRRALRHHDWLVVVEALEIIEEGGLKSLTSAVVPLLESRHSLTRGRAGFTLARLGWRLQHLLAVSTRERAPVAKVRLVGGLAFRRPEQRVELLRFLEHPNYRVQCAALKMFESLAEARIPVPPEVPAMLRRLARSATSRAVRSTAATVLRSAKFKH